ncbi:MAG TPA: PDZ domain-containing protein [Candidatus Hydrogenedentes bacterium]|nr:PDZ domain-containing protein [Candidatus Hydrogenedentota bacterium]HOV74064.1 PDZ domain-containing protein [Candidatus Hydrogenedentota bacterium]
MKTKTYCMIVAAALIVTMAGAAPALSPVLKEMEDGFIKLHQELQPCVVNIETKGGGPSSEIDIDGFNELFRFFGIPMEPGPNMPMRPRRMPRMATGSGFVYDKQGHIITNNHVVEDAAEITVKMWNKKEYPAKIIGRDPDTDLAVIKIEPDGDLPVARLGDSDALQVGQFAIAVGSPRGFEGSFSFGHISALGRNELMLPGLRFQNFIQTDAAINLGNSGGPLCNLEGEVIGINVAIVYGANSIGFAIPVNTAKNIVPKLIGEGKVTRGYLGVGIVNVDSFAEGVGLPDNKGAFVKNVQPGTPAEKAGIKPYDVLRKVNGAEVENSADLVRKISDIAPGTPVKIEIWRDKKTQEVEVTLDEWAGSVKEAVRGKITLGLRVENLTPELVERLRLKPGATGAIVTEVEPGSPAEDARPPIGQGDVIVEIAQKPVKNADDFHSLVKENAQPGKSLLIGLIRAGGEQDITVIKVPKEEK